MDNYWKGLCHKYFPSTVFKYFVTNTHKKTAVRLIWTQDIEDVPNDQKDIVDYSKDCPIYEKHEEKIRGNAQYWFWKNIKKNIRFSLSLVFQKRLLFAKIMR